MANETNWLRSSILSSTPAMESGTAETDYPVTNMIDGIPSKTFRSTNKTTVVLEFDLGSATAMTAFALINHNFSGGDVKIYSHTSDAFGSATLRDTVTVPSNPEIHRTMFGIFSSASARYWWVDLSDNGSVTSDDSYYELGQVVLGQRTQANQQPQPFDEQWIFDTFKHRMQDNTTYHVLKSRYRTIDVAFKKINKTTRDQLYTLYNGTQGAMESFCLILNEDDSASWPCYFGFFDGALRVRHIGEDYYNINFRFQEDSMG